MLIIGISAFYHDAACAIIKDGEIIAAAQEERFTRIKNDKNFPVESLKFCLDFANVSITDVEAVAFYEKPFLKFQRLLETYLFFAPKGINSFQKSMSAWLTDKLFLKKKIEKELVKLGDKTLKFPVLLFPEHHLSHSASAYFTSPFSNAAILTIDAVGESVSASIYSGKDNKLTSLKEMEFPNSVGLLYSAFTYYLGFQVNNGEYKLMGLAPYGNIHSAETDKFIKIIKEKLCTIYPDGSIFLHQQYFNYATGLTMVKDKSWYDLFGFARRNDTDELTQQHCNLALAIQTVTEEIVIRLAHEAKRLTRADNLCLAGGVALNCVANGKLQNENIFDNIYIQPAAGDAGGSIGAALAAYHIFYDRTKPESENDGMKGAYLGPAYTIDEMERTLDKLQMTWHRLEKERFYDIVAGYLCKGKVVGWFQGRMEFGPRALGNRSILADPRNASMQQTINLKIKFREGFRPFAPVVPAEKVQEYFVCKTTSPYMLLVHQISDKYKVTLPINYDAFSLKEKLHQVKSLLPGITHVDCSARIQTVHEETNPRLYYLLKAFEAKSSVSVLINTSFNVREEPIVCTPSDALFCFMNTGMDILVLNDFILIKEEHKGSVLAVPETIAVATDIIWKKVTNFIGMIIGTILLSLLFYLIFYPAGILLRLLGKESFIRFSPKLSSTFKARNKLFTKPDLEQPF
jgi:carbamoyltransferase